jgi:hypothetical protein
MKIHLFVEHAIVFVDIGDIAFFLVETLSREFAFLVDAKNLRCQNQEWNSCGRQEK